MKKAPIPSNEDLRIDDLYSYDILDSKPETAYDEITKLASEICEVPIALISIIDKDRQWFKSRVGLDAMETPRDVSFCGHAINEDEIFEINDANKDERFSDNPLVTGGPKVIFYAGAQIYSKDKLKLGTLCVIDSKPKELTSMQKESLRVLGNQISRLLELRKNNMKLHELILEVERTRDEKIHLAKLASLGQLAGGIAHEINNPLTIISGRAEQLKLRLPRIVDKDSKENDLVRSIQENVKRVKIIIQGMLEFSRTKKSENLEVIEARDAIALTLTYFREKCESFNVQLEENLNENCKIHVNKIQVSQIVTNLFNNAFDATDGQKERLIKIENFREDEQCFIVISDNGPGFTVDEARKILEPFYTTKKAGEGTGLGLSVSLGLAKRNSGELILDTSFEGGAKFVLKFPTA